MGAIRFFATTVTIALAAVPSISSARAHSGIRHIFSGPHAFETCALMADYRAYCWGSTPGAASLLEIGKDIHTMALGNNFRCALTHDKQVWCWGQNDLGQVGNGGTTWSEDPTTVIQSDGSVFDRVTAISAGGAHVCALRDTAAWCWGSNEYRQIGNHNFQTARVLFPTPVVVEASADAPLTNLIRITAGGYHSCALLADKTGACWGDSGYGQLGNAKNFDFEEGALHGYFHSPQTVYVDSGGLQPLVMGGESIVGGDTWTCGLVIDMNGDSVACWGYNGEGELGDTTNTNRNTALPAYDESGKIVDAFTVAAGGFATCAAMNDTTVRCWGADGTGELGTAASGLDQNRGIKLLAADGNAFFGVLEIVAGDKHMCARMMNDDVYCWGGNHDGQLDLPFTTASSPVPVKINIDAPIFTDNFEGPDYDSGF